MSSSAVLTTVRRLRGLLAVQHHREDSDERLLHAFADHHDDGAFTALVHRHGPMVLGVCRRVLGHEQDAEDAFQATFLVLARRAAALRDKTALASFLYGTAYHLASKAKRAAGRRRKHEGALGARTQPRSPVDPADELSWREVRALLDEEIARLPEKYQSVFVLCCLENLGREEAARRLGLKVGTLSSRLAEARKRLGQRLARRGVELTAVLAATVATQTALALPATLMAKTIEAAMATAAGQGLAGVVSASVVELVEGAMMVSKAKIATVVLLVASLLTVATSGSLVGWYRLASGPLAATLEPPAAKADDKPNAATPKPEKAKTVTIQGRVLDPEGKPKAGAELLLLGGGDKLQKLGTTAADGGFRIAIPKERKGGDLIAQADGFGIDFIDLAKWKTGEVVELRLVKDRVIRGRVVNTEGKPVADVRVAVDNIEVFADNSLDSFLIEWKKRDCTSWMPRGMKQIVSGAGAPFTAKTDAEGSFAIRGIGAERLVSLRLKGDGIADDELWIVNRDGFDPKPYNQASLDNIPKGLERIARRWLLYGPNVYVVAEAEKIVRGAVEEADTGKGRPGILVHLYPNGDNRMALSATTKTDARGRYEIRGIRKAKAYQLDVQSDPSAGYLACRVHVADTTGYQPIRADIRVKKGVVVTGKVIDQSTGKGIPGSVTSAVLADNPFAKNYPNVDGSWHVYAQNTTDDGVFRVVTIPGPVLLMGGPAYRPLSGGFTEDMKYKHHKNDPKYPQYFHAELNGYFGYGGGIWALQGTYCKVLRIEADAKVVEQDIVLERAKALTVKIQDAEGRPLTGVWATGIGSQNWVGAIRLESASCSAYGVETGQPRLMVFYEPNRKLAGTLTLKGDEKPPVVAKLAATGSVEGRLLDADGKPLVGVVVDARFQDREAEEIHKVVHKAKQAVTDATGAFTLDELIPQLKFELSFRRGKRKFEREAKPAEAAIQVEPGECRDVGAIQLKRIPEDAGQ